VTAVSFKVLGPLEAVRDGVPVPLGGPRPRAVLAALLLSAGRPVHIDTLVDAVWGDTPPGTAVKTVQKYVSHLRAQLGDGVIVSRPAGYELVAGELDSRRFEALVDSPDAEAALDLWRGEPYGDLPDFAAAQAERRRLAELRMSAVEALAEARLALGRYGPLVGWLEQLVAADPLRERLWGVLMLALYRSGRQAEALAAYQRLRTALIEELGTEPTPALRALHERLLRQDDGRGAKTFPLRLTTFVGRAAELGELTALLAGHRLVTLTGVAGSGKTRLAVEAVAGGSAEAWLVELAGVTDPRRVPSAVAGVLRIGEQAGRDLRDVLADTLAERSLLLVLDNCEHLLDATAGLVTAVLRAAPRIRVLATSRQPLGVAGERILDVPPLPVPATDEPAEVEAADAVRLLALRARAADSRFALTTANVAAVARIARRLDGMPLALELAAARLRVFDAGQLADLLDDRFAVLVSTLRTAPARHQTLRAAVAWSYDLLTAEEQGLFRALAVFEGGFTLDAAERIAGRPGSAVTLLPALVERSLVVADHADGTRYRMLETLREYGRAQLDPDESEQCHRRHLAYHLDLAERLGAGVRGPHRMDCLGRLDAERDNIRAALRWSLTHREHLAGLRLAASLALYWDERAQFGEGGGWLAETVAAAADAPPALRAAALAGSAQLAISLGEHERAAALARSSLHVAREAGDETGVARATTQLGNLALYQGDYADAERHLAAGLAAYGRLGLLWERGEVLGRLGHLHRLRGEHESAREHLEQALAVRDKIGDQAGAAWTLWQLGVLARYHGDYARAAARYDESLAHFDALGDVSGAAHVRYSMGDVARLRHESARATSLYTTSLHELKEQGDQRCVASILCNLGALALDRADPAAAVPLYAQSLTLRRRLHDQAGVAECLEGFAAVRAAFGDAAEAIRLLGAADAVRIRTGASRPASDDWGHADRVEALRSAVGARAFDAAWAAGRAQDGETVAAEVLENSRPTRTEPEPPAGP
jgi:predicted ATPase/DNA-binding SARP family transcriptional activator